jgi:UDP-N-acetylglucosamine--N-acetylmuramyl-(pentapeptide) pyrophosphoryl-undecaprenol N-acetylglucosamine transferase
MTAPVLLFSGGGTGGHLYPALAVVDAAREICPDARCVFACSNRQIDRDILDRRDVIIVPQPVLPLPALRRKPIAFLRAWRASKRICRDVVRDLQPLSVLGLGGFAAAPMIAVAAGELPTALVNPDAIPGKANHYLANRVDHIFTQFSGAKSYFKPAAARKVQQVGCPVRASLVQGSRDEAIAHFGLDPNRKTLLAFGGSTLAENLSRAVAAIAGKLPDSWQVLLAAGGLTDELAAAVSDSGAAVTVVPYIERMDLAYAAADLTVARGGAGTIAELAATGNPALIMPYPWHADRQQYRNAADRVQAGAALLSEDHKTLAPTLDTLRQTLLPVANSPEQLARMTHLAQQQIPENAAQHIARWMLPPA